MTFSHDAEIPFTKMTGSGNDFVVIDHRAPLLDPGEAAAFTRAVCRRGLGIGADGVVLIDPAAHGGHAETDLAMLALFGAPYLADILEGYQAVAPLREGWRSRVPVHQLHPLAVHAVGHGRSYGVALVEAARRTLALVA